MVTRCFPTALRCCILTTIFECSWLDAGFLQTDAAWLGLSTVTLRELIQSFTNKWYQIDKDRDWQHVAITLNESLSMSTTRLDLFVIFDTVCRINRNRLHVIYDLPTDPMLWQVLVTLLVLLRISFCSKKRKTEVR